MGIMHIYKVHLIEISVESHTPNNYYKYIILSVIAKTICKKLFTTLKKGNYSILANIVTLICNIEIYLLFNDYYI